jgi:bifunctional DNA-binding transcriptional regulator/antitoxin component of YhaV-PrlF toxin-antitoxin module
MTMDLLEIPATVRIKNQLTIPQAVAARHGIAPGQQLIIVDGLNEDEFTVRVIRSSYAGALAGVFGTTEQNVDYVRSERESWG